MNLSFGLAQVTNQIRPNHHQVCYVAKFLLVQFSWEICELYGCYSAAEFW